MRSPWLAAAGLLAAIGIIGLIRSSAQPTFAGKPEFEVASIRPHVFSRNASGQSTFGWSNEHLAPALRISGNRVTLTQVTFDGLLRVAYNVNDYQIFGLANAPIDRVFYDLIAKTEGDGIPTLDQIRPMLQTLLKDRFQLKLHLEMKVLPAYDLVIARQGSKLKESVKDAQHAIQVTPTATGVMRIQFSSCSVSELVSMMSNQIPDRPIFDKTGVAGAYDFTLEFVRESPSAEPPSNPIGTSIFTAVQEQLGLKLEGVKLPTEALVIDRAEKLSEN